MKHILLAVVAVFSLTVCVQASDPVFVPTSDLYIGVTMATLGAVSFGMACADGQRNGWRQSNDAVICLSVSTFVFGFNKIMLSLKGWEK